ncbi:MAG: hypothetical protein IJX30_01685 [Clostridia bacterium]|nr:hypothetical protein [Clostridia bacterium]
MKKFASIALGLCVLVGGSMGVTTATAAAETTDFNYSQYADTYMPKTGIALPPSVVFKVKSAYDLTVVATEKSPSVALFQVNDEGDVVDQSGEKLATLAEAVQACANKTIPAFRIESETAANKVYNFVTTYAVVDAMVFSSDAAIITNFKKNRPQIQAGICFGDEYTTAEDLAKIKDTVVSARAHIAYLENGYNEEAVEALQHYGLSCWAEVDEYEYAMYHALFAGVNGIVSNNYSMPIEIMETITKPTLVRTPYLTGHRGGTTYPENTLQSMKQAYVNGADYVEIDIMRTKDNELVVMHDNTLNRTTNYTGTAKIADMTLAEIRQYRVKYGADGLEIPILEDFFELIKTLPQMKLFVELKADDPDVISLLKDKIVEYGVEDNIFVIANWDGTRLQEFKALMPNVTTNSTVSYKTLDAATYYSLTNGNTYGAGISHLQNAAGVPAEELHTLLSQVSVRGIPSYTWTYGTRAFFEQYMFYTTGLTTDNIASVEKQVIGIATTDLDVNYTLTENTALPFEYSVNMRKRVSLKADAARETVKNAKLTLATAVETEYREGEYANLATYSEDETTLVVNGHDKGYQIVWLEYLYANTDKSFEYTVVSTPIELKCGGVNAADYCTPISQYDYANKKSDDVTTGGNASDDGAQPQDKEEKGGCGSVVGGIGAAIVLGGAALMMKKKED